MSGYGTIGSSIVPDLEQQIFIVGSKGSGKSFLAGSMLQAASQTHPVLVIDTKGERIFHGWSAAIVETPDELFQRLYSGARRTLYRPQRAFNTAEQLDLVLLRIFDDAVWSGYLYIDELVHVAPNTTPMEGLRNVVLTGRRRDVGPAESRRTVKIGLWSATQRPRWIPEMVKSESTRLYVMDLSENDLKHMSDYMMGKIDRPGLREFWYLDRSRMREPRLMPPLKKAAA